MSARVRAMVLATTSNARARAASLRETLANARERRLELGRDRLAPARDHSECAPIQTESSRDQLRACANPARSHVRSTRNPLETNINAAASNVWICVQLVPFDDTIALMLGDQIREARQKKGLNQEDAARLAGVSRKQFWKLETGKGVTLETFRRVVTALEMPVVAFGSVDVLPASIDRARIVETAESAIEALRSLVAVLQAARADVSSDEALAAAAIERAPLTADHPTVKMLHELVDSLATGTSSPARRT